MLTVTVSEAGNQIFDWGDGYDAQVLVDGVVLPGCRRCCPAEKWADIMLYTEGDGKPLLNEAGDDVFMVRVVADNMCFEATGSIPDQPETSRHG